MLDSFFEGFEKVAFRLPSLRKLIRPAVFTGASGGAAVGGFAVGKGKGKEEQLTADKSQFEQYLSADYERDVANINKAMEQAFIEGYQYKQNEPKILKQFESNLKSAKKK